MLHLGWALRPRAGVFIMERRERLRQRTGREEGHMAVDVENRTVPVPRDTKDGRHTCSFKS